MEETCPLCSGKNWIPVTTDPELLSRAAAGNVILWYRPCDCPGGQKMTRTFQMQYVPCRVESGDHALPRPESP